MEAEPYRDLGRGGCEFAVVGGDLFGIVLAVAPVNRFVACQGGGVEFPFGRRNQVEMAAPVASPGQASAHPYAISQIAMCRDVADANSDTAMSRPVWRRAAAAQRMMQRKAACWQ